MCVISQHKNDNVRILIEIVHIALPATISIVAGLFAILINTKILGNIDTRNLYLLALFLPISYLLISVYESIRASSLVLLSPLNIATDSNEIFSNIYILAMVSIAIFIAAAVLFFIASNEVSIAFHVTAQCANTFKYFSFSMIVVGAVGCISYIFTSTLYALKKPKSAMMLSLSSAFCTCLFTYLLSYKLMLGMYGYVISTLVAYAITLIATLVVFKKSNLKWIVPKISMRILKNKLNLIGKISIPVGLSYLLIFSSLFFVNIILSFFDKNVIAGYGIAYRIQSVVILPAISIGTAIAILVNRAVATNNIQYAEKIFRVGVVLSILVYFLMAIVTYNLRIKLSGLITSNRSIIYDSAIYLKYVSLSYVGMGPVIVYMTMLEQTGCGAKSLSINIIYFVLSIVIGGCVAVRFYDYLYLYAAFFIVNLLSLGYLLIIYVTSKYNIFNTLSAINERK